MNFKSMGTAYSYSFLTSSEVELIFLHVVGKKKKGVEGKRCRSINYDCKIGKIFFSTSPTQFFFYQFIYLFLAVLGLRFCARAFSSCGERGPLFIAVCGPLTVAASPIAEHRLQTRRLSSCGSRA